MIDSRSVKSSRNGGEARGIDGGKKINRTKEENCILATKTTNYITNVNIMNYEKTYSEKTSRTLDSNPKASRKASIDVILQRYEERNIQGYTGNEKLIQRKFVCISNQKEKGGYYYDDEKGRVYSIQHIEGDEIYLQSSTRIVVIDLEGRVLRSYSLASSSDEDKQKGMIMDIVEEEETPQMISKEAFEEMREEDSGDIEKPRIEIDLAKLKTGLTVFVDVVPISSQQVVLRVPKYVATQIQIRQIVLGDKDRPATQFDQQESHTVAWTLVRSGLMGLSGSSVFDFIEYMEKLYPELKECVNNIEGKLLCKSVVDTGLLKTLKSGYLFIDIWQKLITNLLLNYIQVYQLSSAATYRAGSATGNGEAFAMRRLRGYDTIAAKGDITLSLNDIQLDMKKLLDVQFTSKSLHIEDCTYAVYHWMLMLSSSFPNLITKMGTEVFDSVLSKKVPESFKKGCVVTTVSDMLARKKFVLEQVVKQVGIPAPIVFEQMILSDLKTSFVGNVIVRPLVDIPPKSVYRANDLEVSGISISDKDRPKTQFIKYQKSHAVPWTLIREATLGLLGKNFPTFLDFFLESLTKLGKISNKEGQEVLKNAIECYTQLINKEYSLYDFHVGASEFVRLFFIAYQVADSTTYVNPKEAEWALGHGEAPKMALLRKNEQQLLASTQFFDSEEVIIDTAISLLDIDSLEPKSKKIAIDNLQHKLKYAFPCIMKLFHTQIDEKLTKSYI